jgi:UDPglucose--hexose-1-phosphate uridylyltransferase
MPEYRTDPITGRMVIIAEGRSQRPQEFAPRRPSLDPQSCPFCPGRETQTPGEVYAIRSDRSRPDSPGWKIRAVPNKYPALDTRLASSDAWVARSDAWVARSDAWVARPESAKGVEVNPACGRHEVLIESPRHITLTSELSADELVDVFRATIERMRAMYADPRIEHVLPFKNVGPSAGASLAHLHSQIIGQPLVPPEVQWELDRGRKYFAEHNRCMWCNLAQQEREALVRVVLDSPQFVAFCPFASRFANEVWLLPKNHATRFENISDTDVVEFARAVHRLIGPLESLLDEPSYNYVIRSAPRMLPHDSSYHWHLQILPRATGIAGFELGTGIHINPVAPETAAARLRDAIGTR